MAELTRRAEAAQQTWFRASALAERVSATVRIATDRAQSFEAEAEVSTGQDPEALEAEADEVAELEMELLGELEESRIVLESARAELAEREQIAAEAERAHLAAARAEADRQGGGWPGWPSRSTPCAPGSSRSTTGSRGCRSTSRKPPPRPN